VWLKDEKGKYFDELSSERARSYFRKFVKAWNRGKCSKTLYSGVDPDAQSNTAYKWSFASKTSKNDRAALQAARDEIHSANYGPSASRDLASSSSSAPRRAVIGPTMGPTLPSASDLTLAREAAAEQEAVDRKNARKRQRAEERERIEDAVGPKPVGREGQLEAKRARREGDKAFRERGDDGFVEADEGTLMGGGDDFRAAIARRDAAKKRYEEKRGSAKTDLAAERQERSNAIREKEKNTIAMFQKMAAERFG
jgi:hypothetical protein